MQYFPEFNAKMAAKDFDGDAFMLICSLGGAAWAKYSRSTNLVFRKGVEGRNTWLRMNLPPNEGGYNRLKLHYLPNERVNMEFYTYTPVPFGGNLTTDSDMMENVTIEYMGPIFEYMTGMYICDM